jgi:hypothetical protein
MIRIEQKIEHVNLAIGANFVLAGTRKMGLRLISATSLVVLRKPI